VLDGEHVIVTKSGLDELAAYLASLNAWIKDASGCLGVGAR
jgi:hypothetical protein